MSDAFNGTNNTDNILYIHFYHSYRILLIYKYVLCIIYKWCIELLERNSKPVSGFVINMQIVDAKLE
jgi:hypothetical protein